MCWQTEANFPINSFLTPHNALLQQYLAVCLSFLAFLSFPTYNLVVSHALPLVPGRGYAIPASPTSLSFCLEFMSACTPPFVTVNIALRRLGGVSLTGAHTTFQTGQTRPYYQFTWSAAVNYTDGFTVPTGVWVSGSNLCHMVDLFFPNNGEHVECCTFVVERRA